MQSYWFLQGLLSIIQIKIFYYYKLDLDNYLFINFANLLKKILRVLRNKKKLVDLI